MRHGFPSCGHTPEDGKTLDKAACPGRGFIRGSGGERSDFDVERRRRPGCGVPWAGAAVPEPCGWYQSARPRGEKRVRI